MLDAYGAAFLMVASKRYVEEHNLTPLAEIVDSVTVGGNPDKSPETAILAIQKLLAKTKTYGGRYRGI